VEKTKRKNWLPFFIVITLIIILMFVARMQEGKVFEINGPDDGIEELNTVGTKFTAVSKTKNLYIWDWNNFRNRPVIVTVQAEQIAYLGQDKIIWTQVKTPGSIIVTDFSGDKTYKEYKIDYGWQCQKLSVCRNGRFVATLLFPEDSGTNQVILAAIELNLQEINKIATLERRDNLTIYDIMMSEDGSFFVAVGAENGGAWICLADVNKKQILWQRNLPDCENFTHLSISPDSKTIYAGGIGRTFYSFEAENGNLLVKRQVKEYYKENDKQRIICIDISPDNRFVAVGIEPSATAWLWRTSSSEKIMVFGTGHHINGLVFSPDSSLLVSSDWRGDGKMKIWKVPKTRP